MFASNNIFRNSKWIVIQYRLYQSKKVLSIKIPLCRLSKPQRTVLIAGVPDEREGLLDTITRAKNHYQKRAYQCIKCMVALFGKCNVAHSMLHRHPDLKRSWASAVAWLQDELERKYPPNAQYTYNTWSPPAQSNESSNGYYLERSNSARKTLEKALELMPEMDREEDDISEEQESQDETSATESHQSEESQPELPDVTQSCENNPNT